MNFKFAIGGFGLNQPLIQHDRGLDFNNDGATIFRWLQSQIPSGTYDALKELIDLKKQCGGHADEVIKRWGKLEPPKYRPMTPVEVAAHFGRKLIHVRAIREYFLTGVTEHAAVVGGPGSLNDGSFPFQQFADECTWADTGEPCGIQEAP